MRATLAKFANDVYDIDDLINQPAFFPLLKSGIDEDTLELSEDVAKDYVKKVLEVKPWMKKTTNQVTAVTARPGFTEQKAKDVSSMTNKELEEYLKKTFK